MNLLDYRQLDPISRGKLFLSIKEKERISFQEIARRIKKSASFVVNSVRLLKLPEAVKDGVWGNLISEGHARALLPVNDLKDCMEIYKKILKERASVRETEEMVRGYLMKFTDGFKESELCRIKDFFEKFLRKKVVNIIAKMKKNSLKILVEFD